MDDHEALEELKRLYARKDNLSQEEGQAWLERVSGLLHRLAPNRVSEFDSLTPHLLQPLSEQTMRPIWYQVGVVVQAGIVEAEASIQLPRALQEEEPSRDFQNEAAQTSFWDHYGKPIIVGVVATVIGGLLLALLL
jgi:hypothetical protein